MAESGSHSALWLIQVDFHSSPQSRRSLLYLMRNIFFRLSCSKFKGSTETEVYFELIADLGNLRLTEQGIYGVP